MNTEDLPDDAYRVCGECGHVYVTGAELVAAYNRETERLRHRWHELAMGIVAPPVERLRDDQADRIDFCQECLHDW